MSVWQNGDWKKAARRLHGAPASPGRSPWDATQHHEQKEAIGMFLTTRNPDVLGLTNRVNRLLSDTLGSFDWQLRDSATAAWVPPVDILEEADAIRIMAEVPGIDPKDVKISVEGNVDRKSTRLNSSHT